MRHLRACCIQPGISAQRLPATLFATLAFAVFDRYEEPRRQVVVAVRVTLNFRQSRLGLLESCKYASARDSRVAQPRKTIGNAVEIKTAEKDRRRTHFRLIRHAPAERRPPVNGTANLKSPKRITKYAIQRTTAMAMNTLPAIASPVNAIQIILWS